METKVQYETQGVDSNVLHGTLAERTIPYRPELNAVVGKVTASILLQQIHYWWTYNDQEPFYKFKEPCNHEFYREGDSWCEELGFSRCEFDTALKTIATKKTAKMTMQEALTANTPVVYWINPGRVTYYTINEPAYLELLQRAYSKSKKPTLAKVRNSLLLKQETDFTISEITKDEPEITIAVPAKKKRPREKPPQLPGIPTVEPDTPGADYLFQRLKREYAAKKQRAPAKFGTLAQKEKFTNAEAKADGEINGFVDAALEAGILPIKSVVAYVAACANGDKRKEPDNVETLSDGRTHTKVTGRL